MRGVEKYLVALSCLLAALWPGGAKAQEAVIAGNAFSNSYENAIMVTGRAERKVVPDEIHVRVTIDERRLKDKRSVEQAEREMIRILADIGIDTDKDLRIGGVSSGYKDSAFKTGQTRTTATYELKAGSATQLGQVIQRLETVGISNLNIERTTHTRIREIGRQMRLEAIKDAKQTAEELAGAIGQKIGPAVYISDDMTVERDDRHGSLSGSLYGIAAGFSKSYGRTETTYDTPLEFIEMELSYCVTVKFSLDGKSK